MYTLSHSYFLYFVASNIEDVDIEYEVFCKKWFEVGINPVKQETEVNTPSHGSSFQSSPYYMHSGDYDKGMFIHLCVCVCM